MKTSPASYLCFAGIDTGQRFLDVHLLPSNKAEQFANDAVGHGRLIDLLKTNKVRLVVIESTGGYEHAAVIAMVCAGVRVCVAQPQRIRDFAKSLGLLAKTDKIDAAVVARYAKDRADDLRVIAAIDQTHETLRALIVRRDQVVADCAGEKNRLQQASDKETLKSIRRAIAWKEREVARVEKVIDETIKSDAVLTAKSVALQTLKGVGAQTARLMVALLPELGEESDKRLNALVGVAPYAKDSGSKKGARQIRGGRTLVRNGLFMSCMTAVISNPTIAAYYKKKREEGKQHKEAMVPCMRKQLSLMNKVVRMAMEAIGVMEAAVLQPTA